MNSFIIPTTIPSLFSETLKKNGDRNALSFIDEKPLTYKEVDQKINSLINFLEKNNIKKGDRVAILGTNMPNWGISFYAVTFKGAVAVPILPDFSKSEIQNVINHSESKLLIISSSLLSKIEHLDGNQLKTVVLMENFLPVKTSGEFVAYSENSRPSEKYSVNCEDLASIIYTSGTTGKSKGVMLSHGNITFNAIAGSKIHYLDENDRFLSVLPLSHTYENTLGLILPMLRGACVYYLRKPPTPAVLLPALGKVRPTAMLTVPLIIEKIYFNKILPSLRKNIMIRSIYKIPPIRKLLNRLAGKKLMKTFGGELRFYGIGGAKLNSTVEKFLIEASFPYAIGYGLTETSPLLAGAGPANSVYESTGPSIEGVELKIHNPDPVTGEGEIWAKGPNVMIGYFKDPELTAEVITSDGWFKTGDLDVFDKRNNLYIKGRAKNVIVGASGENIYPEEIESLINSFRHVVESIVIEQKGKLVALVHLNIEEIEKKYNIMKNEASRRFEEKKEEILREIQEYVNSKVNKFSRISKVVYQPLPFEKTATQKIKRYIYK
ncbi:MAG TPA: AMP-binding protein [Bacteroidales bacterium]|nr:AMP-binding protein [Bacteroidales bacterium]HRR15396.1 AMP-binding protein [Bacteroidales bacterium]